MLVVMVFLLILQITWLRLRLISRRKKEERFLEVWQPVMAATIAGESVNLPLLSRGERVFFLKLWNHLQESLRGASKSRLNEMIFRCGILPIIYDFLHKKSLRSRLIALSTLGHLGERVAWDEVLRLSLEQDALLSLSALRALFQIDAGRALHELLPQLLHRDDWQTPQLAILVEENGTDALFVYLADAISRLSDRSLTNIEVLQLKRLLRLFEVAPPQRSLPVVRRLLATSVDDEIIAEGLKFMSAQPDLPVVRKFINHQNWAVRLQAVRALGRIGMSEDVDGLIGSLSDPVWWVRYRAAQALLLLVRGDGQILANIKAGLSDQAAHDMMEMVIAEEGGQ